MAEGDVFGDEPTKPGIPVRVRTESTQAQYTFQLAQEALAASARAWLGVCPTCDSRKPTAEKLPASTLPGSAEIFRKCVMDWIGNAITIGREMRDEEVRMLHDKISKLEALGILKDARIERLRDQAQGRDPRAQ
jgi:hypothetical protein